MKAKEYFDRYDEILIECDRWDDNTAAANMYKDFVSEMKSVIQARGIKTDASLIGTLKEFNQKWNSVVNMFEKKYGSSPIIRNGFSRAIATMIPEAKEPLGV